MSRNNPPAVVYALAQSGESDTTKSTCANKNPPATVRVTGGSLFFHQPDIRSGLASGLMWTSVFANHVKRHSDVKTIPKADLQDSAVDTVWSRVVRLVKKPESVPLTLH
jgi:hypothetical protein